MNTNVNLIAVPLDTEALLASINESRALEQAEHLAAQIAELQESATTTDARTKPNIREIGDAVTLESKPVMAGDKVAFWTGSEVAYHVVTKGEMVKVERYRSRSVKQRQHSENELARAAEQAKRDAKRAQREAVAARQAEAARRAALHTEAVARIAAASK